MLLFISSPTNDDYYQEKNYCAHEGLSRRGVFEMLKDREKYPGNYRVAVKEGKRPKVLKNLAPWRK